MIIECGDLRIAVRELTHRERLELWNEFLALPEQTTDAQFGAWFDHALARRCVKALYRQNGTGLVEIGEYHDAEGDLYIALPVTGEIFDNLPARVAAVLALALKDCNQYTIERILEKKIIPPNLTTNSETE